MNFTNKKTFNDACVRLPFFADMHFNTLYCKMKTEEIIHREMIQIYETNIYHSLNRYMMNISTTTFLVIKIFNLKKKSRFFHSFLLLRYQL